MLCLSPAVPESDFSTSLNKSIKVFIPSSLSVPNFYPVVYAFTLFNEEHFRFLKKKITHASKNKNNNLNMFIFNSGHYLFCIKKGTKQNNTSEFLLWLFAVH
ncbi:MAG: hypothetical protein A2W91_13140 [Bacteroidetes bacterium GWF2_38_335]|nr:MAG: hypothetical protein A2W91_13140 [Bacteroidetes bacterium GWF2_38_335]OFY77200.1 MAG: hypothetical protein A2281_14805 [Bacteroidetes bacterium RIFOXYA12_FULL_38_20]HBS85799.1 hypothetical protein [Bacteroidales bacterium]